MCRNPLLALILLAGLAAPAGAQVNPDQMVDGSLQVNSNPNFPFSTQLYTVPADNYFVLTDFNYSILSHASTVTVSSVMQLQENASTPRWLWRVVETVPANISNWPVMKTFATGLVFQPGSTVDLHQAMTGSTNISWSVSWGGYLVPMGAASLDAGEPPREGLALRVSPTLADERTTISFELGRESEITLAIFDVQGRKVRTLFRGALAAGMHQYDWDGRDDAGKPLGDGVYFARINTEAGDDVRRMTFFF
jgi:hypothetical protein